ncbi:sulfatase-like hydrolase/transferase [Cellulosilyticum ruminicola]|uniref:sulfatase-like hydrolase/transferase n=1 Tax=Cellulosilyticum ruminicola TaxID=425254 RepID=UPI0006D1066A|nr:sulfatase-like hydrolase/transferase [Cellulosilyticum ruminicola]
MKKVIEEYENNKQNGPVFIHTVTMENHMPYDDGYKMNNITVNNDKVSEESKNLLETYANSVKNTDKSIKYLIDYFSKIEKPTIIVVYGDHAPALGDDYKVYRELGYISQGDTLSIEDYMKLYQTPFMIWNNYDLEHKRYEIIDASYLGSLVLDYAGINSGSYIY